MHLEVHTGRSLRFNHYVGQRWVNVKRVRTDVGIFIIGNSGGFSSHD